MERSVQSLTKACAEGVNVTVLAVGSAMSTKSSIVFDRIQDDSVVHLIFRSLFTALEAKASAINNSTHSSSDPGLGGASKKNQSFSFEIWASFVEFYEETMTDLLSDPVDKGRSQQLVVEANKHVGNIIRNLTDHGPITALDAFQRLLEAGKAARRNDPGLYGDAKEFSSAILKISLKQSFFLPDASSQELHSTFSIVECPATDRLARPGGAVRLSEGPLLNKALFTLADVIECAANGGGAFSQGVRENDPRPEEESSCPPYDDSHLTAMLHDAVGGNCLTFALLCIAPSDFHGSKATLQLGRAVSQVSTFPVVNNDMIQGLLWRHHVKLAHLRDQAYAMSSNALSSGSQSDTVLVYERKIHELEGKLAHETLEKRLMREDKEKLVALMNELKVKYNELFDNEIEVRKELLACEQEKLALSKAFVEFEVEKNNRLKEVDSDKFEMETKLIQAEQMVVEIQQDDCKKATQIQDLCAKMNELIREKQVMSEEVAMMQKHTRQVDQELQKETKKNQQLSLELLVAVNQKQKSQNDMEGFEKRNRQLSKQLEEILAKSDQVRDENAELKEKQAAFGSQLESMRRELVMKDLEAEKFQFSSRKSQMDQETEVGKLNREYEDKINKLTSRFEAALVVAANEKKSLELQAERLALETSKCSKEKEELVGAWMGKLQENEELLVANERLIHENESQIEAFRMKLSFFMAKDNRDEGDMVKELICSYQVREKELRNRLAECRSKTYRLEKRIRARPNSLGYGRDSVSSAQINGSHAGQEDNHPDEKCDNDSEAFKGFQQEIAQVEGLLVLEREKYAAAAFAVAEYEKKNQCLDQEREELKRRLQQSQSEEKQHVRAIQEMHETLLKQLDDVRRITVQQSESMRRQQSVGNVAKRPMSRSSQEVHPVANGNGADVQSLIQEKQQLEAKLAANTKQWTALVEQVERRCSDLLTKNVMLVQENSDLRGNLKVSRRAGSLLPVENSTLTSLFCRAQNVMTRYQNRTNK